MLKKDFASKYFIQYFASKYLIQNIFIEQIPLKWLIICCRVYFMSLSPFNHDSAQTEKHFREIHN